MSFVKGFFILLFWNKKSSSNKLYIKRKIVLIRGFATLYCCTSLLLCGMDLEIVSSKKLKKRHMPKRYDAYFKNTLVDTLPTELKDYISNFIMQLSNVNFDTIDCYDTLIKKEKNPKNDDCVYYEDDEVPLEEDMWFYLGGSDYKTHVYPQKNLKIHVSPGAPGLSYISTVALEKRLFQNHYQWRIHSLIKNCFSPHANVFVICGDSVNVGIVNNGKLLYKTSEIINVRKVLFCLNKPVIKIIGQRPWSGQVIVYKLCFSDSTKKLLRQTVFTWRQALLIGAIFENNTQYERSVIFKKSAEYYVFKELDKKIRHFFKKYLNVKTK